MAFASDTENPNLPVEWANGLAVQFLDYMWRSFDILQQNHIAKVDLTQPLEQLERDLTKHHYVELLRVYSADTEGLSSFQPHREWDEHESLSSAAAKPPAYDFAFVNVEHRRWALPIEAKVLQTPGTLADYVSDIREKFESGIAAPLVGEGGMIGYLLSGSPVSFFTNLESRLAKPLESVAEFENRAHRTSRHPRNGTPPLRLHHMIMDCSSEVQT